MAPDFYIKQGALYPSISTTLEENDTAYNLTDCTVTFYMRLAGGGETVITAGACTVLVAASGTVKYEWQAGDTDTAGDYEAEWHVETSGGDLLVFPDRGYNTISVYDAIE